MKRKDDAEGTRVILIAILIIQFIIIMLYMFSNR